MEEGGQLQLKRLQVKGGHKKSPSGESLSSLQSDGKACVCSPTKHRGSFRCRQHRQQYNQTGTSASPFADQKPNESDKLPAENK